MLWGLLPFMTGFMMLSQRANLARSNIAGRYYMRLVLPVMALLVFIGSAGAQSLPEPLGAADVIQYKRLIELQKNGNMKQAIREMGRLKDPVLKGHLLAQRYLHPTAWRSSYKELSSWLAAYNDHPDASRIYWLAKRRKPKNARSPKSAKTRLFEWLWSSRRAWLSAAYSGKQCWSGLANTNRFDCAIDPAGNPSWLAIRRA
jgi:hypothetical protein